ncbi:hypothetical protein MXB_2907 [Myxobolus squamalis]|nr:hypothetical protein MXB_2907 [Myxobolus squamalis]
MNLSLINISSPVVTVYFNLPDDSIKYALNLTKARGIMVDEKSYPRILKLLDDLPFLEYIITTSHIKQIDLMERPPKRVKVIDFIEFIKYESDTDPRIIIFYMRFLPAPKYK